MYIAKKGRRTGLEHRRNDTNSQDAVSIMTGNAWVVGVVCDGSGGGSGDMKGGSGERSETGALRASEYLTLRLLSVLEQESFSYYSIFEGAYLDYIIHLQLQVDAAFYGIPEHWQQRRIFVENHLFHTVVGVAVNTHTHLALLFSKGDGYFIIDDAVEVLSEDNDAQGGVVYPAMALSTHHALKAKVPFRLRTIPYWNRLAVCSDGLRYVPPGKIQDLLFSGDDDPYSLETALQFAVEDGWLKNEDDLGIVTVECLKDKP